MQQMGHTMATTSTGSSKTRASATAGKTGGKPRSTSAKPAKPAAKSAARPKAKAAPAGARAAAVAKPATSAGGSMLRTAAETQKELKKKELIEAVVERSGVRKKYAKPAVEAMIDILGEAIAEGRELNLQPLGKITRKRTKDTTNARVTMARIRQSKHAGPALDPAETPDAGESKETVADAAE